MAIVSSSPKFVAAILAAVVLIIAIFISIAKKVSKEVTTPSDYFLAGGGLNQIELDATYLGTNVTLTSILIALAENSYQNGFATFWIIIAWILGMGLFYWIYPRFSSFFDDGETMHEFLGRQYNSQGLRMVASIITVIVFAGTIGLELYGIVFLLNSFNILPTIWPEILGLTLAIVLVTYTVLGGFKVVVSTDKLQLVLIGSAVVGLIYATVTYTQTLSRPLSFTNFGELGGFGSDPAFIIAMLVLFVPFQLSVMDMWQRCAAVGGQVKHVQKMILTDSIGFIVVYSIPIVIGIMTAIGTPGLQDPKQALLIPIINSDSALLLGIIFVGLLAAVFSTADTLLVCASHSFVRDVISPIRGIDFDNLSSEERSDALYTVRVWTIVIGISAVGVLLAFNLFSLFDLIIAVFSAQIVFIIPLLIGILNPEWASGKKYSAIGCLIVGFVTPIFTVIWGKFIGNSELVQGAPILGLLSGLLVFVLLSWHKSSNKVEGV